jgi:rod shape-determining protein MreC
MRISKYFHYVILALFLLIVVSLPKSNIDKYRNISIACLSPCSKSIFAIKNLLLKEPLVSINESNETNSTEMKQLLLENTMLKNQINGLHEWLFFENRIEDQVEKYKSLKEKNIDNLLLKEFFQRRAEELKEIVKSEYEAVLGKVIFRDPSSWSSSLWINLGEKNNEDLSHLVIAKNSPVVLGQNLVGVVEYVGYSSSRIRLITDAGLIPSVRAARGNSQDKSLLNIIQSLKDHIYLRDNLFSSSEEKEHFFNTLFQMSKILSEDKEEKYLAKGELSGSSQPLWRAKGLTLKGIGFNYDYPDAEGPTRSFKSKDSLNKELNIKTEALLEVGDLLVTTGMDGIFPKGLHVAIVSKVHDMNDGDYAYEIEAKPTVTNLNELEYVFVLPPINFEGKESQSF